MAGGTPPTWGIVDVTGAANKDWRKDFGVDEVPPPRFFKSKQELGPNTPQAHLLRRAFDLIQVDGVLCVDHSPLVYFKLTAKLDLKVVYNLHRQFWNHGGAPLLVLISDDEVHVYSGMQSPTAYAGSELPSLVATLARVPEQLQAFLTSVDSGEFFRSHSTSFDPKQRVDRSLLDNLKAARDKLASVGNRVDPFILDALLCRLVFTCYLFDRGVIGESYLDKLRVEGTHLRDVLKLRPISQAKASLYRLFEQLEKDFNGELFSDDLNSEADLIGAAHVEILRDFFEGTSVETGQGSFWPYEFGYIPIETISAIYEHFLKEADKEQGSFYTPRFLAEVVLDAALDGLPTLLGVRFLDPACGSGIFLVGLFNRIAEEWKQANPNARNDRKARELIALLQGSLFGIDINPTACRITAFSLSLAYLDQLSPRDIQELQAKGRALPTLIASNPSLDRSAGNIWPSDFFDVACPFPENVAVVVGNPPWGSVDDSDSAAVRWCLTRNKAIPDKQIAAAFIWKAVEHAAKDGRACLVLPHGVLFNHSAKAVSFQKEWVRCHSFDRVINLADFQRFLFENAEHPAVIVTYGKHPASSATHRIQYWSPKCDWTVTKAEVITVAPQDRATFSVNELLQDLESVDAPQIWKRRYWATPRDWRLLDRLALYPRLRDHVRKSREADSRKRWIMAEGFQPYGDTDRKKKTERKLLTLPTVRFIEASSSAINLFLLEGDCTLLSSKTISIRSKSNRNTDIFRGPHVLVAKGFTSTAYVDFDVAFRHALRGIHGPREDSDLLAFLSAYLNSGLAKYFLFHTSSNWGISRQEVHVREMLRLPFPMPDQQHDPKRSWKIVREVARLVRNAARHSTRQFVDRAGVVREAMNAAEPLITEYFDVIAAEKDLVSDTVEVIIPSARPTRDHSPVPTLRSASAPQRRAYCKQVCDTLNEWSKPGKFTVHGETYGSDALGVAMAVFEKVEKRRSETDRLVPDPNLLVLLDQIRRSVPRTSAVLDLVRGVMAFEGNRLYVVRPIGQRHWTQTAALNDADRIAGTILMTTSRNGS